MVRQTLTAVICFLFPVRIVFWLLNLMGHKVHASSKIGFSIIWLSGKLTLEEKARIGHFNLIKTNSLSIAKAGYIEKFNSIKGPIEIDLKEGAAIGNGNKIYRAPLGVTYGTAVLQLDKLAKITGNHRLDCTRSIFIGEYTTIAGHDSQLWTHGYYLDKTGPGRFRLDGEIQIGSNVNLGSRCVINAGVTIANAVVIGSNSTVSKSLLKVGTYVSQPLRYMDSLEGDLRLKYKKLNGYTLCEEVYFRNDKETAKT